MRTTGDWPSVIDYDARRHAIDRNLYLATRTTTHIAHSGATELNPWIGDGSGELPILKLDAQPAPNRERIRAKGHGLNELSSGRGGGTRSALFPGGGSRGRPAEIRTRILITSPSRAGKTTGRTDRYSFSAGHEAWSAVCYHGAWARFPVGRRWRP